MVLVSVTEPSGKVHQYHLDDRLKANLDKRVIPALTKKDEDYVLVVDGEERFGKSTLAMQIGKYVDPTLTIERICFSPDEFRKAIIHAKKGQCIIFDEAYRGLSSKGVMTEVNKILVSLMMEMGQKNLFIIIVLPTFFLLEKYVALWRARGLFHVIKNSRGQKGFWIYFNRQKKKVVWLKGKKDYSYGIVRSGFKGKFYNYYVVDEESYRDKKAKTLSSGYKVSINDRLREQRDHLLWILSVEGGFETKGGVASHKMSMLLAKYGLDMPEATIRDTIKTLKAEKEKEKEIQVSKEEVKAEESKHTSPQKQPELAYNPPIIASKTRFLSELGVHVGKTGNY
jgi:hypothetical protein